MTIYMLRIGQWSLWLIYLGFIYSICIFFSLLDREFNGNIFEWWNKQFSIAACVHIKWVSIRKEMEAQIWEPYRNSSFSQMNPASLHKKCGTLGWDEVISLGSNELFPARVSGTPKEHLDAPWCGVVRLLYWVNCCGSLIGPFYFTFLARQSIIITWDYNTCLVEDNGLEPHLSSENFAKNHMLKSNFAKISIQKRVLMMSNLKISQVT